MWLVMMDGWMDGWIDVLPRALEYHGAGSFMSAVGTCALNVAPQSEHDGLDAILRRRRWSIDG